jgi:hypothetical protein
MSRRRGEAAVDVPAATIDSLLGARLAPAHHVLLKLDLQGHELRALRGAEASLPKIDVALVEVSFFSRARRPSRRSSASSTRRASTSLTSSAWRGGRVTAVCGRAISSSHGAAARCWPTIHGLEIVGAGATLHQHCAGSAAGRAAAGSAKSSMLPGSAFSLTRGKST